MKAAAIWFVLVGSCPALAQTTWYVDAAAPGPGTGTPDDPFARIQDGVGTAADGDTILVLPGTYLENVDFSGKALSLVSRDGPDVTVIQGQRDETVLLIVSSVPKSVAVQGFTVTGGQGHPVSFDNLITAGGGIFASGVDLTLDHDTIEQNKAGGGGGAFVMGATSLIVTGCRIRMNAFTEQYGAGLAVMDVAGVIQDSTFESNNASGFLDNKTAGGLYARSSRLAILGDEFVDNHAGGDGIGSAMDCSGGMYLMSDCWIHDNGSIIDYFAVGFGPGRIDRTTIENNQGCGLSAGNVLISRCEIRGNVGVDGGGGGLSLGHALVRDCVIEDNRCLNFYGAGPGGIRIDSLGGGIVNCVIKNNEGAWGGISVGSLSRRVMILGCRIEGNRTNPGSTGGIIVAGLETKIVNCFIAGNQGDETAAINANDTEIQGCTVTRNKCLTGNAITGSYLDLRNDIVWGDQVPFELVPQVQVRAAHCDIQGTWPSLGMLDVDPLFVAPDADDFHLSPGSPLIDRGQDHTAVHVGIDIDGERRVRGSHIDIGADEAN